MRPVVSALLCLAVTLGGCGGGGAGGAEPLSPPSAEAPAPQSSPRPVPQSNLEIAQRIYSAASRTPADFYSLDLHPGSTYLTVSQVKNRDVTALPPAEPVHEVCTDDLAEALAWSGEAIAGLGMAADLVETGGDGHLFEFVYATREAVPRLAVERVFKCSYLDRSSVDLSAPLGAAGTLHVHPVTAQALREISEYLWTFSIQNNFGRVVLASQAGQDANGLFHDVVMARLQAGGAGQCDRIEVLNWRHRANVESGALTHSEIVLFEFDARQEGSQAVLCAL